MEKYINATRLIGVLDSAIARTMARGNAKSIDDMWCDMACNTQSAFLKKRYLLAVSSVE